MPGTSAKHTSRTSRLWLAIGGLLLSLLLSAVFTLGSLQIPFEPGRWNEVLILFALSTFIVALFVVFLFVFLRTLLRMYLERRAGQLGARFRTKMVAGAMAISLLPVVFMFFISYALLNRTLNRWFPRPLEIATEENLRLLDELGRDEKARLDELAKHAVPWVDNKSGRRFHIEHTPACSALAAGAEAAWTLLDDDTTVSGYRNPDGRKIEPSLCTSDVSEAISVSPRYLRTLPSGAELWEQTGQLYLASRTALVGGELVVGRRLPRTFIERYTAIETQIAAYNASKQGLRALKNQLLLVLALFTVLVLFSSTWAALFLAKQVTVPITALAEGTRAVTAGDFAYRVAVPARDELGALVASFNQMTAQLADNRTQLDAFTQDLQNAVNELERRRKLLEALLESIPTAVFSLESDGTIRRTNPGAARLLGERARDAKTLDDALSADAARSVRQLMAKSLRMGAASKELELALPGRSISAAVTVSALGPRRANPGFVVVLDDITELLRAQKSAAWQEVAQRIAHEIKNPLTPILLSVQRLERYLEKSAAAGHPRRRELEVLVAECSALIQREVAALKALVDEFSRFARFPTVKPAPADLNGIVTAALDVFHERLEGIEVQTHLAENLPPVRADAELLRGALVNLVDNAAEALEGARRRRLRVETRLVADGEACEVEVADSGHGISPEDKEKLFLPHFSTRQRGTGLGLAIASRIVSEHQGTLRVEDNDPAGARFILRLPLGEAATNGEKS